MSAAHFPAVKERRAMLTAALASIREQGYTAHINLIVAEAQNNSHVSLQTANGLVRKEKKDHVRDLRDTIENSRRAAQRLQEEIDGLGADEEAVDGTAD